LYLDKLDAGAHLLVGLGVILKEVAHFRLVFRIQMSIVYVCPEEEFNV
jgi:hypothetical protein